MTVKRYTPTQCCEHDGTYVTYSDYQKLVAENAALKAANEHAAGCINAAMFEGLVDVMSESSDERLVDLVNRRLLHAYMEVESPATNEFISRLVSEGCKVAMQNVNDIAHCLSDIRRFVEAKFMTVGDLPSPEGLLLSGPEWKHESDAIIAALNRVAEFYETPATDAAIAEIKRPLIEEIESLKKNSIASFSDVMEYNPETGIVTAKVGFSNRPAGMPIGSNTSYGYLATSLFGKKVQIHRLAWFLHYGEWPEMDIDHINGIKKDNRISNLRLATISQNQFNKPIQKNNSSGVKGVYWNKRDNKFIASVQHQGKKHTAGRFDDLESAKKAVEDLRVKLAGEFCNHGEFAANLRAGRKG